MKRILMEQVEERTYLSEDGYTLQREWGKTPNGNNMNGRWVYRNSDGKMIDWDQYRNDLAERNDFVLTRR